MTVRQPIAPAPPEPDPAPRAPAGAPVPPVRRRSGSYAARVAGPLVVLALLVGAWWLYVALSGVGVDTLPSPGRVVSAGWDDRAALSSNAWPTLWATLLGFSLSLVLGFALSAALDFSGLVRGAVLPVLVASQTLPLVALAPLVILWFGFGLLPKVLLVAFVTFFPITVGLVEGYAATDRDREALLRSMGASRTRIFRSLRLPTAMPFFFAGLRIAITYAVVAAIFAEYAGSEKGLGIYMQAAKNSFRTDLVLAAVLVSAALTLVLFALTFLIERLAIPWAALERRGRRR